MTYDSNSGSSAGLADIVGNCFLTHPTLTTDHVSVLVLCHVIQYCSFKIQIHEIFFQVKVILFTFFLPSSPAYNSPHQGWSVLSCHGDGCSMLHVDGKISSALDLVSCDTKDSVVK